MNIYFTYMSFFPPEKHVFQNQAQKRDQPINQGKSPFVHLNPPGVWIKLAVNET